MKKLYNEQLEKVNGGVMAPKDGSHGYFHVGCGGYIENVLNPFASCHCSKCGETHYFANSFNKYQIYGPLDGWCRVYDDGHIDYLSGKPEELDWDCNK